MFNPFPFIFVILELKFFLTVAHWGHEAKHKLLKKMLQIGDNVAHWGVAHKLYYFFVEIRQKLIIYFVNFLLIIGSNTRFKARFAYSLNNFT